jgi:hypothetical protein
MANTSISLVSLDFDSFKQNLKTHLKSTPQFKDYDFEASNISVLLDLLAYNTYNNSFYLNMIASEMFLDSAQIRDSVVSHAKELNYLPRSFRSSKTDLEVTINSSDPQKKNITIPKGTGFTSRIGANTFLFTTDQNVVVTSGNSTFKTTLSVYEGDFITDRYVYSDRIQNRYTISNKNVDLQSLKVIIVEDQGSVIEEYKRATTLLDLDETSKVYFLQAGVNERYDVLFGDGIVGKKPKNDSGIILEYRVSSGELPNGCRIFRIAENIDNESNVVVTALSVSTGGAVNETIDSIKFNAPRSFGTQERAVTAEDYENLLKQYFPEINAVSAFGGEEADPPQYGKVFVSVDLQNIDGLPKIKEEEYKKFLRTRSTVSMEPVFVSPDYTYIRVDSNIKYNINRTGLNPEDMKTIVISSILNFASINLNSFAKIFRYSKLISNIDSAEASIVSNETEVKLAKYLTPKLNAAQKLTVDFKTELADDLPPAAADHPAGDKHTISSSFFTFNGVRCNLEDDGNGKIRVVTSSSNSHRFVAEVGTVDYAKGRIEIKSFNISSYEGNYLKIYARTRTKDIQSSKNVILNILEPDVNITVEQIRE